MKCAQIFRYKPALTPEEYRARWQEPYAEAIAKFAGLIRTTWMADFDVREFDSVSIWQDKASTDLFKASPSKQYAPSNGGPLSSLKSGLPIRRV